VFVLPEAPRRIPTASPAHPSMCYLRDFLAVDTAIAASTAGDPSPTAPTSTARGSTGWK
jgi:hypothetical protein